MRWIASLGWLGYVLVVAVFSVPFYALGLIHAPLPLVPALPLSAIMVVVPTAAAWLIASAMGERGLLLARLRGWPGIGWALLAFGFMPVVFWLTAAVSGLTGADLPAVQWLSPASALLSLLIFGVGAVAEEFGWQGYAYPRMAGLGAPLRRALVLGGIWALWHLLPFWEMGHDVGWILWHGLAMVAMRVVIVWLSESAGPGLMVAVLFHTASNAPWGVIGNFAAFYDPRIAALLLWAAVGAIVTLCGPGLRVSRR